MAKKKKSRSYRANFVLRGPYLEQIEEVQSLLACESTNEAVRLLVRRGLEAIQPQLTHYRTIRKLEAQFSPQELLPLLDSLERAKTE